MKGMVKTYLTEKQYGFIVGSDGKDYFFHYSSFVNQRDTEKICEGLYLEFEQKATPKGYSAVQISLSDKNTFVGYEIPETIYTSKDFEIKGWEVMDLSNWIIHGSSRDSPDIAKKDMMHGAKLIGANSLLNVEYYKTTGSEPGTGRGTYYFTIHNFKGRAANIAKKSLHGKYSIETLKGINEKARLLKDELVAKTTSAQNKRIIFWLVIFALAIGIGIFNLGLALVWMIVVLVLAFLLSDETDYDSWLEEMK